MKSWTMKELNEVTNKQFILHALLERRRRCTNDYSPLYEYITKLMRRVEQHCPDNFTKGANQ